MYDALLDEFEDDAARTPDDEENFEKLSEDDSSDDEDDTDLDDTGQQDDEPEVVSNEEDLLGAEEGESWSDDPVRMYLTQMGEIPLLTRQEEIRLAKKIEVTRRRFRSKLLECDYVIQAAYKILKRVHQGELPFDRTVQVSVTDRLEKDQILGRLPHNLATLDVLLRRNRRDYRMALGKSANQGQTPQRLASTGQTSSAGRATGRRTGFAHAADRTDDSHAGGIQPAR